jgi:hypothetical protein
VNAADFCRILFLALDDPDERLSRLAREVKATVEREDICEAYAGVSAMAARMGELRRERCNCEAIRSAMGESKPEHKVAGHEPDCVATNGLPAAAFGMRLSVEPTKLP